LRRHDGAYRWFLSRAVPIRDAAGRVVRWFGTNTDVTEQREAESALERARDEAVAASRAKDDFLAALSHELRTPLNPVLLVASDAADDPTLPDHIRADFEAIRKNVSLEARLIDDLLDLTRISRGKLLLDLEAHDVHAILRDALGTIETDAAEKAVALTLELQADSSAVRGDAVRLQQVFWNVLKNAVKFTPEYGRVAVVTRTDEARERIEISVTDTGIGLRPEELTRIFDAFAQGDHATSGEVHRFGGLGLGLAISRMVVAMHDGTIRALSEGPGRGATFIIELPLAVDAPHGFQADAGSGAAAAPAAGERPGSRLLLVEDHAPTRTALERLLLRRKFVVTPAGTLAEARALLQNETFDLLISDVGLPDGSGCDLMCECAHEHGPKGIALTGYGMEPDIARSRAAGFSAHLIKPVSMQALDRAIAEVLPERVAGR
jgi:signal transduction histidine kinase/CheY-like chemotaxis protein